MAPYLIMNASSTLPLNSRPSYPSQATIVQFSGFNQKQWNPDAIGTIVFGIVMFLIGITALWQGRPRHEADEEQGHRTPVGGRPAEIMDEVATGELSEGFGSERVAVGRMDELCRADADDMMEQGFVKIGRGMRTDTEGTLVGEGDDDDDDDVKDVKDGKGVEQ